MVSTFLAKAGSYRSALFLDYGSLVGNSLRSTNVANELFDYNAGKLC